MNGGPLMGFDRVVMLLINSSDMSAAVAAGAAARTTYWHRAASSVGIDAQVTKVTGDIREHRSREQRAPTCFEPSPWRQLHERPAAERLRPLRGAGRFTSGDFATFHQQDAPGWSQPARI